MEPPGVLEPGNAHGSDQLYHSDLENLQQVSSVGSAGGDIGADVSMGQPCSFLQALAPLSYTGNDTVSWLRDSLLTLRLEGTAAADVAVSGERWHGGAPDAWPMLAY